MHSGVISGSWTHSRHALTSDEFIREGPFVNKKQEGRAQGPKRVARREGREESSGFQDLCLIFPLAFTWCAWLRYREPRMRENTVLRKPQQTAR